ncbi:MAG TPA: nuclear transport factor 2 family protein [Actinomycetota bacterium]
MTSHEHPNVSLTREGLEALDRGDFGWFDQHVADDVVWHVGGNNKLSGEHRGKQAVMEMFARSAGGISVDTHDVLANDDHAVVLGTAKGTTPDGQAFEYKFVNVFHIRDGKTVEAWGMSENDAQTDPIFDQLNE